MITKRDADFQWGIPHWTEQNDEEIQVINSLSFMNGKQSFFYPASAQHLAPVTKQQDRTVDGPWVPSFIGLRIPDGPGSSLPFSSSDTVEGSAHGNNPENRARKASRKNSDMVSESGL